jgi:thiaminase/transcriptional activator TenA
MTFTEQLWDEIKPIYAAILAHPFINELAEGNLSRERFVFYMQQDSLYLQDFSRALGLAGVRSPSTASMQAWLESGARAVTVEQGLHEVYFEEFGAKPAAEKSPACLAYTSYLKATAATGTYAEAVAALLPCFWIYREVGTSIFERAQDRLADNPYRRWIETYSGEAFARSVDRALGIVEDVAREARAEEQASMRRAFVTSARLEWMFWDSAYRLERWPPQ